MNIMICEFLLNLANCEKSLENLRLTLCEIPDFNPLTAFKRIDNQ